ncbi:MULTISPECIES: carbohydrate ABC transporter permease [Phyllobacteriaceae]|jgi:multiple sugar transport system permease protein|uniref:ABC transporter permease n=1 Tax=Mesorhizobium hungaricum TaxID=1566387 RepID=A0A1C2DYM7_9HYPH|nr:MULTISPECIES: sugar ABC transporter permease [Mesorhizobium]MBN9234720.1 sugar ABC transporter permease [Mesorhizobium sp.]MDQ0328799.1 multiple sugar transport system permease protein [Mesorhizobium sp. YL-MeA3-2017]OCX19858.1 ABC transporter permease [Mesorhizobium hungaricum]
MAQAQQDRTAWLLLTPMIAIMVLVTAFPLLNTLWLAFTDASLTGQGYVWQWVGFENFAYILDDADFRAAVGHTAYFTVFSVSAEVVLGVLVALLLNQEFRGRAYVRALLILPWALPTIVNAVMWRLIYNPEYGSLNALLTQVGLLDAYRSWLGDPSMAMNMVILADVWKNYPLIALIALAGLQTVPKDLYEAAIMDGANAWIRFWKITIPGIMGSLTVAMVLRAIEAFKVFDIFYVMTRGGPADSTKTVSFFVYQESFTYLRAGSGAAYALTVTTMSAMMIAVYVVMLIRREKRS